MKLLIEYFDSGNIFQNRYAFDYRVSKLEDITPPEKIIPFFPSSLPREGGGVKNIKLEVLKLWTFWIDVKLHR